MKKRDSRDRLRQGGRVLLLIYLACVVYFMFFSEAYGRTDVSPDYRYNLVLFREIRRFWQHRDILGTSAMLINIVGNVAMVIPFGFAVPLLFPSARRMERTIILAFLASLLAEIFQLILRVGCFDVDDLLLNTMGGAIGYLLFAWFWHIWRKRNGEKKL